MPRVVRGQLALETGERLRDLATKILHLHEYSGDALGTQLQIIDTAFGAQLQALDVIVRSCRMAKNSYPNYPALRSALAEAGEVVYGIREDVGSLRMELREYEMALPTNIGHKLLEISQQLRLVQFVPPEGGKAAAQT